MASREPSSNSRPKRNRDLYNRIVTMTTTDNRKVIEPRRAIRGTMIILQEE
jgi:hypothetical protein